MDTISPEKSIFSLLTKLCEHELSRTNKINSKHTKRLRSKIYQTILFPKTQITDPYWHANCTSVEIQYLTWQLHLQYTFKKPNIGRQVNDLYQTISNSSLGTNTEDVLKFLLLLRRPPEITKENDSVTYFTDSQYRFFTQADFQLGAVSQLSDKFSERGLDLNLRYSQYFIDDTDSGMSVFSSTNASSFTSNTSHSMSPFSLTFESDSRPILENSKLGVWDTVSKLKFTDQGSWHALGDHRPSSEKPFFSELSTPQAFAMIEQASKDLEEKHSIVKLLSKEECMRHLQCLVVGIASSTFQAKEDYFVISPNVTFKGITQNALKACTSILIKCGSCYKVLYDLVQKVSKSYDVFRYGHIYLEFLNGVRRYLSFYHASTLLFAEETDFYAYHTRFHTVAQSLFAITSLLKVGPYKEKRSSAIPTAVELINYLHRNILAASNKHVRLTLLSIMFPCLQIYFTRFLRPWLFQGVVHDAHGEFFIRLKFDELTHMDRRYWTRAFSIDAKLVPDFLEPFAQDILDCGRVTNVLNRCLPNSVMCQYFKSNEPNLIQFCLTQKQLERVERYLEAYELKMHVAEGSTPFSLNTWLTLKEDEELLFCEQLTAQRAASMKRIQQQRLEKLAKEEQAKLETCRILRETYNEQLIHKEEQRLAELARDLKEEENLQAIREKSNKLIEEEAARMIAHYDNLMQTSSVLSGQVVRHLETHKAIQLDLSDDFFNDATSTASVYSDALELIEDEINANSEVSVSNTDGSDNQNEPLNNETTTFEEAVDNQTVLTEVQRNKLRVLREEYGETFTIHSERDANRICAMRSQLTFNYGTINDNDTYRVRKGNDNVNNNTEVLTTTQVDVNLNTKNENEGNLSTVGSLDDNRSVFNVESVFHNASTQGSFVKFLVSPNFELKKSTSFSAGYLTPESDMLLELDLPLRIAKKDTIVPIEYLDTFIRNSVTVPLSVQMEVVQAALLRHFVVDLECIKHLEQLRNYYFLLDGEYSRNLTNDVFKYVYAMDSGRIKSGDVSGLVFRLGSIHDDLPISFCLLNIPKQGGLRDIDALDGLTIDYYVKWPLNILIPQDALDKYTVIFQFLIKIHRVLWVLKNTFKDLRLLKKRYRRYATMITMSQQYQRVQLYRHQMMHFVQTFQNYIVGEVLQSGWSEFQKELRHITSVEKLYELHANYVKQVAFLCFLNKKSAPMRKVLMNIFTVILKFFDYLRSREWVRMELDFCHPNFHKLQDIFENFREQLGYFFRVGRKVTLSTNQPQFVQLIDMLDSNGFYSAFQESAIIDDEETLTPCWDSTTMFSYNSYIHGDSTLTG